MGKHQNKLRLFNLHPDKVNVDLVKALSKKFLFIFLKKKKSPNNLNCIFQAVFDVSTTTKNLAVSHRFEEQKKLLLSIYLKSEQSLLII